VTRQRISLRTPALAYLARAFTAMLALIAIWYGLMLCLLALKISPSAVNSISAYRNIYAHAAKLGTADFSTTVRLIAGSAGLLAFLILGYLALQELPRPHLAREELKLADQEHGALLVRPHAVERIAETVATAQSDVTSANARLADRALVIGIRARRASTVADSLRSVREHVHEAMATHDLPDLTVHVTLTGYDPQTKRDLA